jgi:hypothetical protein
MGVIDGQSPYFHFFFNFSIDHDNWARLQDIYYLNLYKLLIFIIILKS